MNHTYCIIFITCCAIRLPHCVIFTAGWVLPVDFLSLGECEYGTESIPGAGAGKISGHECGFG
jgi:hypothetical protein